MGLAIALPVRSVDPSLFTQLIASYPLALGISIALAIHSSILLQTKEMGIHSGCV